MKIHSLLAVVLVSLLLAGCKTQQSMPQTPAASSSNSSQSAAGRTSNRSGGQADSASSPSSASTASPSAPSTSPSATAGAGAEAAASAARGGHDREATGEAEPAGSARSEGLEQGQQEPVTPPGGPDGALPEAGSYGDANDGQGGGAPGLTADEAVGQLDEQLNASLAVFDGMILTERAAAQAMGAGQGTGAGNGGADDEEGFGGVDMAGTGPLFEEADLSDPGTGGAGDDEEMTVPPMPSGDGSGGSGTQVAGASSPGGHGNVPADVADGSDDDIVARQIREAAMKESDPVLRDKLWEEYRKYKRGAR